MKNKLSAFNISKKLNIPINIVVGLVNSGLFGFTDKQGRVPESAVLQYDKFGTQWDNNLIRSFDYSNLPEIDGWENAPTDTFTELQISKDDNFDTNKDTHWLAQLYIKPNYFFFPDPSNMALIGSCSVHLDKKIQITSKDSKKIILLYPHPDGTLGLISVFGNISEKGVSPIDIAIEYSMPILSELSFQSDSSITISQKHWISLPSGRINIQTKKKSKKYNFSLEKWKDYHIIRQAKSLYFTAVNSNELMSQFLSFYRVIEATKEIVMQYHKASNTSLKIPEHPAYGSYSNQKVNKALDSIRKDYRNAIAHADSTNKIIISECSRESYQKLALTAPVVRFIAREYITIIEKGLKETDPQNNSLENELINISPTFL